MKPVYFSRHALEKILKEDLAEEDAIKAIREGKIVREGGCKLKACANLKKGTIIVVCADYPDHVKVITVIRRRG